MRAKLVENIDFERKGPKASMGLGGVDFLNDFAESFIALWEDTLSKIESLAGKTITGDFEKYWSEPGGKIIVEEGNYTLKVLKIYAAYIEIMGPRKNNIRPKIIFSSVDEDPRYIWTGGKIYIEDES